MLNDWKTLVANNRQTSTLWEASNPKLLPAFGQLNAAQQGGGALDARTRELIALAVAVTTRCDGCIGAHAAAAQMAGVTHAEIGEALSVAIALNAGAAYIYSLRALDSFAEFGDAGPGAALGKA